MIVVIQMPKINNLCITVMSYTLTAAMPQRIDMTFTEDELLQDHILTSRIQALKKELFTLYTSQVKVTRPLDLQPLQTLGGVHGKTPEMPALKGPLARRGPLRWAGPQRGSPRGALKGPVWCGEGGGPPIPLVGRG